MKVVFTSTANDDLLEIYAYLEEQSSTDIAERFVYGIVMHCESLRTLPYQGLRRDDLVPGLRVTGYRRRVTIAFSVDLAQIDILGIFYGGRDYESVFRDD